MKPPTSLFALPATIGVFQFYIPSVSSQWIYPPNVPSNATLASYTNGSLSPITSFRIHDAVWGDFSTPDPSFSITRCAHSGFNEPIYPLNSTFNSSIGRTAPDGTWEWMDNYQNGLFPNIYNKGDNLWVIPDFEIYVGNETTGHICWWELYRVSETRVDMGIWSVVNGTHTYSQDIRRVVTLLGGDTGNYFATVPFVVNTTMRTGNRNYTWSSSGPADHGGTRTTISISNRPTGNAAPRVKDRGQQHSLPLEVVPLVGAFLGLAL